MQTCESMRVILSQTVTVVVKAEEKGPETLLESVHTDPQLFTY